MGCRRRTNWWVAEILVESITLFVVFLSFYLSLWWLLFQYLLRFSAIAANVPNSPWFTSIVCMCVYEYQYTITCAYISLVLSLFRFHVDLLEQWTVVHYLIWLVCLAACFVFVVFFPSYSIHYYGIGYRTFCLHHIAFPIAFICGTLLCNVKQYW